MLGTCGPPGSHPLRDWGGTWLWHRGRTTQGLAGSLRLCAHRPWQNSPADAGASSNAPAECLKTLATAASTHTPGWHPSLWKKKNNQILLESRYRLDPRLGKAAIMTVMATTSCRENRMHTLPAAPPAQSARRERPDNTQGQNSHRLQSTRHLCKEPNKHEGPTSWQRLSRNKSCKLSES